MKEDLLDILLYLFDTYYIGTDKMPADMETFGMELYLQGFTRKEIDRALNWLQVLGKMQRGLVSKKMKASKEHAIRIYTKEESLRLSIECQALLQDLQNKSLLSPVVREMIIDRIMATDAENISIVDFRRLVGLVMFNHPMVYDVLQIITELNPNYENMYH